MRPSAPCLSMGLGPRVAHLGLSCTMVINDIYIDGFGVFHNVWISDLAPGLTIFEGENETGKTTLMSFIRAVLFGFDGRKGQHTRYAPQAGGKHGGSLSVRTPDGQTYRIERNEGGTTGRVVIADADGHVQREEVLHTLLHGTSKTVFHNVFAFGLSELQQLDTLQAEDVGHHIYTAGTGTGGLPFAQIMRDLDEEQGLLFKPGGKNPTINALLVQLEETLQTIRELHVIPDEYEHALSQVAKVEEEIAGLTDHIEQAERRVIWLEGLVKARPHWERHVVIQRALDALPPLRSFPEGGVERLDHIDQAGQSLDHRQEQLQRVVREAKARCATLVPDQRILRHEQDILALGDDREHVKTCIDGLPAMRVRVDAGRQALDDVLSRLGSGWNDQRVLTCDTSIPMRERLRECRARLTAVHLAYREATTHDEGADRLAREKESEIDRLNRHVDTMSDSEQAHRPPVAEREEALHQWDQAHHQRELVQQHHMNIEQLRTPLDDHLQALEEEATRLFEQVGIPVWMIGAVGLLIASMMAASFMMDHRLWGMALMGCGIVVTGLLLWQREALHHEREARLEDMLARQQSGKRRLHALLQDTESTEQRIHHLSLEMDRLSELALGRVVASPEEIRMARRSLEVERRMIERKADLEVRVHEHEEILVTLREDRGRAQQKRHEAESSAELEQAAWTNFLNLLGISTALTPEGAGEVFAQAEQAKVLLRAWEDHAKEFEQILRDAHAFNEALNLVLEECGWDRVGLGESAATLATLKRELEEQHMKRRDRSLATDLLSEKHQEEESLRAEWWRVRKKSGWPDAVLRSNVA